MSRLLENQAAQLLRETNTMGSSGAAGNIDGFSNIAFPIVRRVFGGLVANELVSIQPMSLPSGLLFYLDYSYGSDVGGDTEASSSSASSLTKTEVATYDKGDSLLVILTEKQFVKVQQASAVCTTLQVHHTLKFTQQQH